MSAENIEAEVIALVAQGAEIAPERVKLTSRLLHDLGIDDDDAVGLFNAIHQRFGTDFTYLDWSDHFGPEGWSLSMGLAIIPAAVAGGFAFLRLNGLVGNLLAGAAAVLATATVVVVWIWIGQKTGFIEDVKPITVGDLVRAVEAGAWPRLPE